MEQRGLRHEKIGTDHEANILLQRLMKESISLKALTNVESKGEAFDECKYHYRECSRGEE